MHVCIMYVYRYAYMLHIILYYTILCICVYCLVLIQSHLLVPNQLFTPPGSIIGNSCTGVGSCQGFVPKQRGYSLPCPKTPGGELLVNPFLRIGDQRKRK